MTLLVLKGLYYGSSVHFADLVFLITRPIATGNVSDEISCSESTNAFPKRAILK